MDDAALAVDILAQVTDITADVYTLDDSIDFDGAQTVLEQAAPFPPRVRAEASVLGFLLDGTVRQARNAVLPGTPVYAAPDDLLRRFFSRDVDAGGRASAWAPSSTAGASRSSSTPTASPATWRSSPRRARASPTWRARSGGPARAGGDDHRPRPELGLRPAAQADRGRARPLPAGAQDRARRRIDLYRVPGIQNRRYSEDLVGPANPYTIRFSDLEAEDLCDVAGVPQTAERIREAVGNACARLRQRNVDFDPADLTRELAQFAGVPVDDPGGDPAVPLEDVRAGHGAPGEAPDGDDVDAASAFLRQLGAGEVPGANGAGGAGGANGARGGRRGDARKAAGEEDEMRAARMALRYVRKLVPYPVWGHSNVDLDRLLSPMKLTVIDLAGTEKVVMAYTAEWLLSNLWQRALAGELRWPVFVVLEEAHNLVPGGREVTKASRIVNTVASEGRKFGVFLIVITQRPSKIADDTLSQCASQLIMRLTNPDDQKAVQRASEVVSQALLENLPGLNQGEVVVLGRLARNPGHGARHRPAGRRGRGGREPRRAFRSGPLAGPGGAGGAGGRPRPAGPDRGDRAGAGPVAPQGSGAALDGGAGVRLTSLRGRRRASGRGTSGGDRAVPGSLRRSARAAIGGAADERPPGAESVA